MYAALLDARATGAQTGGNNGGRCANREVVETFDAAAGEDLTDQAFEVTEDRFRISFQGQGTGSVTITINDENDDLVESFTAGDEGQRDALVVDGGPGSFSLDSSADTAAAYTITVEECLGGGTTGDEETGETTDEDTDEITGEDTGGVIDDTIPDRPMPNTGGPPPALVAGGGALLLLYGGLFAWRLRARERQG